MVIRNFKTRTAVWIIFIKNVSGYSPSSTIKNWKDTKHINIHENAQNKQTFKNFKWYNQRMRTGGRYDKRKGRRWSRHWGRPIQDYQLQITVKSGPSSHLLASSLVYKFSYTQCVSEYVCSTMRTLHTRVAEHAGRNFSTGGLLTSPPHSNIRAHALQF